MIDYLVGAMDNTSNTKFGRVLIVIVAGAVLALAIITLIKDSSC
jgi:hypothetical protein